MARLEYNITTTSVYFSTIALTSNDMLTRLLKCVSKQANYSITSSIENS